MFNKADTWQQYQRRLNRRRWRWPLTREATLGGILLLLLASLIFLGGCAGDDFTVREGQTEAIKVIWHDVYGFDDAPLPIEWVHDVDVSPGYAGITLLGWKIRVACRFPGDGEGPCNLAPAQTELAHELYHLACYKWRGNVDTLHDDCDWDYAESAHNAALADAVDRGLVP